MQQIRSLEHINVNIKWWIMFMVLGCYLSPTGNLLGIHRDNTQYPTHYCGSRSPLSWSMIDHWSGLDRKRKQASVGRMITDQSWKKWKWLIIICLFYLRIIRTPQYGFPVISAAPKVKPTMADYDYRFMGIKKSRLATWMGNWNVLCKLPKVYKHTPRWWEFKLSL